MTTDIRYPVGPLVPPSNPDDGWRAAAIDSLAAMPAALRAAVTGLTSDQLDTEYRPGGWTVRQVVHHVADSHLNAYTRLRLALTEEVPVIRPYDEAAWAKLADARTEDPEVSLRLIEQLHQRFVTLWRSLPASAFSRRYRHPESGEHDLTYLLAMYEWHGRHHVAHITSLRNRMGWR